MHTRANKNGKPPNDLHCSSGINNFFSDPLV